MANWIGADYIESEYSRRETELVEPDESVRSHYINESGVAKLELGTIRSCSFLRSFACSTHGNWTPRVVGNRPSGEQGDRLHNMSYPLDMVDTVWKTLRRRGPISPSTPLHCQGYWITQHSIILSSLQWTSRTKYIVSNFVFVRNALPHNSVNTHNKVISPQSVSNTNPLDVHSLR